MFAPPSTWSRYRPGGRADPVCPGRLSWGSSRGAPPPTCLIAYTPVAALARLDIGRPLPNGRITFRPRGFAPPRRVSPLSSSGLVASRCRMGFVFVSGRSFLRAFLETHSPSEEPPDRSRTTSPPPIPPRRSFAMSPSRTRPRGFTPLPGCSVCEAVASLETSFLPWVWSPLRFQTPTEMAVAFNHRSACGLPQKGLDVKEHVVHDVHRAANRPLAKREERALSGLHRSHRVTVG